MVYENTGSFYKHVFYCDPTIENYNLDTVNITYKNDADIEVKVNTSMILQSSIDIKPTGKKVIGTKGELKKIEEV